MLHKPLLQPCIKSALSARDELHEERSMPLRQNIRQEGHLQRLEALQRDLAGAGDELHQQRQVLLLQLAHHLRACVIPSTRQHVCGPGV